MAHGSGSGAAIDCFLPERLEGLESVEISVSGPRSTLAKSVREERKKRSCVPSLRTV